MKRLKLWLMSILVVLALSLYAAAHAQEPSRRPDAQNGPHLTKQAQSSAAQTQSYSIQPTATSKAADAKPAEQAKHEQQTTNKKTEDSGKEPLNSSQGLRWSDWLQVVFNIVLAIATVALAIFSCQLVSVTRDLHTATEKGTQVAEENVKAAKATADAARAQLEFTKVANEQNIQIAKEAGEAAKRSAEASAQNVEVGKMSLRAARPYLLVTDATIIGVHAPTSVGDAIAQMYMATGTTAPFKPKPSAVGIIPTLPGFARSQVNFKNFGKGPAIISVLRASLKVVEEMPKEHDFPNYQSHSLTTRVVAPDESWNVPIYGPLLVVSEEESRLIRERRKKLVVLGVVSYLDLTLATKDPFITTFCWLFSPKIESGFLAFGSSDETVEGPPDLNRTI